MNILVINCGSTSTKYKLFPQEGFVVDEGHFSINKKRDKKEENVFLQKIKEIYSQNLPEQKLYVAFRVVHGGNLKGPIKVTKKVLHKIEKMKDFAPIHNAIFLKKFEEIHDFFGKEVEYFASFDTDFHQTIPLKNSLYPIPLSMSKKYSLKRYGFHGLAVESALEIFKKNLKNGRKKLPQKIIFAHLGGGSSLTAVVKGESVANTMGLTPISGLVMTTRVGEVDSDLDYILVKKTGKNIKEISKILNHESGIFGLTGSKDIKEVFAKAEIEKREKKSLYKKEELAFDIYLEKLIEKIYAFSGKMNGVDSVVFSGGIGKGNTFLRKEVLKRIKFLGLEKKDIFVFNVDEEKVIADKILKIKNT